MNNPEKANDDLRNRLTADQYYVTQEAGTEPAFSGCYWDTKEQVYITALSVILNFFK